MAETYDTAMSLLKEASVLLGTAAAMCEDAEDAAELADLSGRIAAYLTSSRSSTMLGMPRIVSAPNPLSEEMVVRRNADSVRGHVRILPD
jgi:hypothetical protein